MTALYAVLAVLAFAAACAAISRATAMPGARGVPISSRLAEARRIAAEDSLSGRAVAP